MKFITFLFLFEVLSSVSSLPVKQNLKDDNPTVRIGLTELFKSTGGSYWKNQANWNNNNVSYCQWYGVKCDSNSNVVSLDLSKNNLNGLIPSTIGNLKALERLDVSYNQLTAIYQSRFSGLPLHYLDLSYNQLRGSLPAEFGSLNQLTYLNLAGNRYFGLIDASLGYLTSLETLDLSNNELTSPIPRTFRHLQSLKYLNLGGNEFKQDLSEVLNLLLTTAPNLYYLDLSSNYLSGPIPDMIKSYSSLTALNLYNNALNGTMPSAINALSSIRTLNFANNKMTGISLNLVRPSNFWFSSCSMNENNFKCPIPEWTISTCSARCS